MKLLYALKEGAERRLRVLHEDLLSQRDGLRTLDEKITAVEEDLKALQVKIDEGEKEQ